MNPCPSARPAEGEQGEDRQGAARSAGTSGSEDRGMLILFLLGCRQSPGIPIARKRVVAEQRQACARDGSRKAETRNPGFGTQGARFTTARSFLGRTRPKNLDTILAGETRGIRP
jgi:hypothetical protein